MVEIIKCAFTLKLFNIKVILKLKKVLLSFIAVFVVVSASANQSQIIEPVIGSTITELVVPVMWQADPQATMFLLLAGTSPNGQDLSSQFFMAGTQSAMVNIPNDVTTLFLTLYTVTATGHYSVSESYTVTSNNQVLAITHPSDNSILSDKLTELQWEGPSANYTVMAGSTPGGSNIFYGVLGPYDTKRAPLNIDLNGDLVFVTIQATMGDSASDEGTSTQTISATYLTANDTSDTSNDLIDSGIQLVKPVSGSALSTPTVRFEWTADLSAEKVEVKLGSTPGGSNYAVHTITDNGTTFVDLPLILNGEPVYLSLSSYWGQYTYYTRQYEFMTVTDIDKDGIVDSQDPYPHQNNTQCTP